MGAYLQADWPRFAMPGPTLNAMVASEPLVARLESLSKVWEYELTLCTFVVTFFLNQAMAWPSPSPSPSPSSRLTILNPRLPRCRR